MRLQNLDTGKVQTRQYGSVINACGHHWDPLWPDLKGEFKGVLSHAHSYRSPQPYKGKRVCIIGAGNSGTFTLHQSASMEQHRVTHHSQPPRVQQVGIESRKCSAPICWKPVP